MIMDAARCTIFEPLVSCLNQGKRLPYLLTYIATLKPVTKDARPCCITFQHVEFFDSLAL